MEASQKCMTPNPSYRHSRENEPEGRSFEERPSGNPFCFGTLTAWARRSFDAHARQRASIGCEQEDTGAVSGGGKHHSLGESELHLARRQIRDHRRKTSNEILGLGRRLDAGEDWAVRPTAGVR